MAGEATGQADSHTQHVADELVLRPDLPLSEIERRIGIAIASAGLRHRAVAYYLRNVHERGLHQLAGHRSVVSYVGELTELILKVAQCATSPIEPDAARKLAEVSRQTPREALRLEPNDQKDYPPPSCPSLRSATAGPRPWGRPLLPSP